MSVTYIDAIHDAQKDLLTEDKDVFLYGQDHRRFRRLHQGHQGPEGSIPGPCDRRPHQ